MHTGKTRMVFSVEVISGGAERERETSLEWLECAHKEESVLEARMSLYFSLRWAYLGQSPTPQLNILKRNSIRGTSTEMLSAESNPAVNIKDFDSLLIRHSRAQASGQHGRPWEGEWPDCTQGGRPTSSLAEKDLWSCTLTSLCSSLLA